MYDNIDIYKAKLAEKEKTKPWKEIKSDNWTFFIMNNMKYLDLADKCSSLYESGEESERRQIMLDYYISYNVYFEDLSFDEIEVTGLEFKGHSFIKCRLSWSTFRYCDFVDCKFYAGELAGLMFTNCIFVNCTFEKIHIMDVYGPSFKNCIIKKNHFIECRLEPKKLEENEVCENKIEKGFFTQKFQKEYPNNVYIKKEDINV